MDKYCKSLVKRLNLILQRIWYSFRRLIFFAFIVLIWFGIMVPGFLCMPIIWILTGLTLRSIVELEENLTDKAFYFLNL